MPKSPDAFRTISEVADWLGIQAHVLRFWESKFTQVKPIKRAGGRRYYRPADMLLLGGIRKLLHDDGLTIKGVQKILREEGMSHVAAMSFPLEDGEVEVSAPIKPKPTPKQIPEPEEAVVLPFEAPKEPKPVPEVKADEAEPEAVADDQPIPAEAVTEAVKEDTPSESEDDLEPEPVETAQDNEKPVSEPQETVVAKSDDAVSAEPEVATAEQIVSTAPQEAAKTPVEDGVQTELKPDEAPKAAEAQTDEAADPVEAVEMPVASVEPDFTTPESADETKSEDETAKQAMSPLPSFLRKPANEQPVTTSVADEPAKVEDTPPAPSTESPIDARETSTLTADVDASEDAGSMASDPVQSAPDEAPKTKARDIGMPKVTAESEIHAESAALSHAYRKRSIDAATARQVAPLLIQLTALRDRMASRPAAAQPKS